MNYDPIHDTYTEAPAAEPAKTAPSVTANSQSSGSAQQPEHSLPPQAQNAPLPVGSTPTFKQEASKEAQASASAATSKSSPSSNHATSGPDSALETPSKPVPANKSASINALVSPTEPVAEEESAGETPRPGHLPSTFRSVSKGFKHLKKSDGEPFWRKDIQHDFLEELFSDSHRVFTNYFPFCEVPNAANGPKLTFGELYVRTLAESSKSSKVLRERLIKDPEMGISVSKVCFLVNAGRMNTTVNFVPDMRSALRTYHSIPSLQASPDGVSKPLQDTPRLKTILKAVCDNQSHLSTLLDILRAPAQSKPNTNVIKLIFMMSTFFQNIPFHHEGSYNQDALLNKLKSIKASPGPQNKFMEFFLSDDIYPENRARRFLWLMYTYLETSFTSEELAQNPFGSNVIPPIEHIPEAEQAKFDIDTSYEVDYAVKMYQSRMMHLNEEVSNSNPKKGNKSKKDRLKMRKQVMLDPSLRSDGHDDEGDDSMAVDDTMNTDDGDAADDAEHGDDSSRPNFIQHYTDRSKRKKPTASVGSLVDDSRKFTDAGMKGLNPEFPLPHIDRILARYQKCTRTIPVPPLAKDSPVSLAKKKSIVSKSNQFVSHVAKVTPDFEEQRKEALDSLYRYFQYKKDSNGGLLGIEWEDIRNDLVNGVESYLYQQLGKAFVNQSYDRQVEEERYNNGEPDLLKREKFVTRSDYLPGDLAPIDLGSVEALGHGYVSNHDMDQANERKTYKMSLLSLVNQLIEQNNLFQVPKSETFHFDLDRQTIQFKKS